MKTTSFTKFLFSMLTVFAALFAGTSESSAQTTLAVGDISFTAFNSNTPDNFAFVTWVPIQTGTYIKFTDGGYNAAASATQAANARGSENFVIWQNNTGSTLAAGTVVKIEGLTASAGVCTAGSASGLGGISATGDQIFAYQGSATSGATPDYSGATATATFTGTLLFGLNFPSAWITTGSASSNTSYLPTELNVSNGNIAIATASATSAQYSGSRSNQATLSAYRALVNNPVNWTVVTTTAVTTIDTTAFVLSGPSPTLAATGTLTAFTTTYGTASAAQTVAVSGTNLTANITATAPTGFEVSSDGAVYGSTATFVQSGGAASGTLSVRLAATAAVSGSYNAQNIALTSTGATAVNLGTAASGNAVAAKGLTITGVTASNKSYDGGTTAALSGTAAYAGLANGESFSVTGTPSAVFASAAVATGVAVTVTGYTAPSANYTVTQPSGLTANITAAALTVTATSQSKAEGATLTGGAGSTAFTSSGLVNGETIGSVTLSYGSGALAGDPAGAYAGSITPSAATGGTFTASNYSISYVAGTLTVMSGPALSAAGTLSALDTTYGTATPTPGSLTVSGGNLTANITVTAPTGFEVSTSAGAGYGSSVTLTPSGGSVASTTVYVRLAAATNAGTFSGNVVVASSGAESQNIATAASTVSPKGLTITGLSGVNREYDGGTTATLSSTAAYAGLANGESFTVTGTPVASFATKTVGTAKAVTVTGYTAPSANYTVTQPAGLTANISAKALTVTGAAVTSKAYDGTTAAVITGALSGVVNGDTVTLSGTGTFGGAGVGTGIAVTSTSTLGGADAGNYTLTQPTGLTGSITQASQTISFGALASKTTADAAFALTATASSGLSVSYGSSNTAVATVSGNTVTIVGAGTSTITASQAGDTNYAAATPVDQTLTVGVPPTTLGAGDIAVIGYNTNATPDNFTILVLKTLTGGTTFFVNDNEIAADGGTAFTDLAELETTFTVKAGQTIPAGTVITLPWGGAATSATYDWNSTGGGLGNNNDEIYIYTAAAITDLTPTAFIYGAGIGTSPSARPSGLTLASTWIKPSGTAARYKTTGATYSGTQAQLLAAIGNTTSNWEAVAPVATTDWTFSLTSPQTITFGTLAAKTFGDAPFSLGATASSGLAVAYASSNTAVATVSGSTVTIVGAGTTVITASQAGDGTYAAATSVPQTLTVAAASQSISGLSSTASKTYGDATYSLGATASSGLSVSYASSNPAVATVNAGVVTVVGAGTATITASQAGNTNYLAASDATQSLTIAPKAVTIIAGDVSKAFGTTLADGPGFTAFTAPGLVGSDAIGSVTFTFGTGAAAGAAVGTYAGSVTPSAATSGNFVSANYSFTYAAGAIVVTSAPTVAATGTLSALDTIYGTATPTPGSLAVSGGNLTANITVTAPTGFEVSTSVGAGYGSSVTLARSGGTVSSTTVYVRLAAATNAGTYSGSVVVASSGVTSQNIATAASTVSPKGLTITGLSGVNREYDGGTTATLSGTAAYAGLANGESFSVTGTPVASFATKTAGTAKAVAVTGYTAPSANYTVTQPAGLTANITAKALTVNGAAVTSRPYDGTTAAVITGALSGVVNGDAVTLVGSGTFASANAGTGIAVTSTSTLGGADAGNYTLSQPTGLTGSIVLDGDATLSNLVLSAGSLNPSFAAGTLSYAVRVSEAVTSLTVTPSTTAATSTVKVNGTTVTSGAASSAINLSLGSNTVTVAVTAQDSTVKTYTVAVTRSNAFTPGNLVVIRADSAGANTASGVSLVEYTTAAAQSGPVQTIAVDSTAAGLTLTGNSATQGVLTRSSDGTLLTFGGFRKAAGGTNPQSDTTATANRVVGIVGASGTTVDLSTAVTDGFSADSFRAVATVDGTSFYLSGAGTSASGGVRYVASAGSATTSAPVNNGAAGTPNTRQLLIAGGQLLVSSGSANPGIGVHKVGSGLPTSGTQTYTPSITTTGQIQSFYFTNLGSGNNWAGTGFDTLYTSDATNLTKWSYTGSAWVSNGSVVFTTGSLGNLAGSTVGSVVTLYGTTNVATTGTVFSLSDSTGFNQALSGTPTTLATVASGAAFRGIAFAPVDAPKIFVSGNPAAVSTTYGTPSATPAQCTVSGTTLTGDLTVTAPAGFEVSASASSGYGATLTLSPTGGTLAATVVYVRIAAATAVGTYSGNLTVSGGGATQKTIATAASTVSAASLTITGVSAVGRAYDATTTATLSGTAAYAGLKNGDTFTVTGTPVAAFDTAVVGATKPVTVTGYTAPSANYTVTQPAGLSAAITPAALTITASGVSKTVGNTITGATGSVAFTASGLVGGETVGSVTITYGSGAAAGAVAGTYAGSVVPSAATGGTFDPANYSLSYVAGTLTVTSGAVLNVSGTLVAVNTTYGTASLSPSSFTLSGSNLTADITVTAPAGFEVSTNSSTGYAASVTVARTGSTVASTTVYVRIAATAAAGTYTGNFSVATSGVASQTVAAASSVVLPKTLTLSGLTGASRVYDGGTTATLSGTPAYVGLVNGDSPAVAGTVSATFATKTVGTAKPLTVTGYTAPSANYTVTQPTGLTADITAKTLTVTGAAVTSKSCDNTTAAVITGTLSGVVNGDTVTFTGVGAFASANVGAGISVTSSSTLGGADAGNYTLTQPTGLTGAITKGSQTITFDVLAAKTVDSAPFALTATASSGLGVSYASSNPAVATVSGSTVTIVGVGTTAITASQAGDANFNAATPVDQVLTVNAASTLAPGDIAVIGYNTAGTPSDNFTILILKDLPGGASFFVGDNEIAADGGASFTDLGETEVVFTVKAGQTIPAGTVITLPWGGTAVSTTTYDWNAAGGGLGNNNEEIYIYTASSITDVTPIAFLYGVGIGASPSARPAGLTLGSTWIKPSGSAARYKTTGAVYSGTKATLLAAIGDTAANWETVAPVADTDWTFTVSADSPSTGTVAIADASLVEGNSGTSTLSFTVTRSNAATAFTVGYATADGTGASGATTADGDYVATSGTLTFTAGGALTQTIAVTVNGDTVSESSETLLVNLSNVVNSVGTTTLGTSQAVGTITNDDADSARITSQPASRSVVSGRTATLTVVAAGTPAPTYQWYFGASGTTSSPVVGATSASYTTPVLVSNASYWVRATNATGSADSTTAVLTVAQGTPFSSAGLDVLEPNTVTWNPAGVTLNGTQFVNLGLQGMGRVAASTKDPVTGESLGSVSDMQVSGWRRNADGSYSGTFQFLPDRGYNNGTTYSNYAARLNAFDFTFTPYTSTSPTSAQNQIALTFAGATRFTYDHDGNAVTPGVFTTGLLADGTATLFGTTVPVATGAQVQSDGSVTGRLTLDSEGLVLDQRPGKAGSGWIGDEYGASIYHFNAARQIDGQLRVPAALVPHKPAGTVNFNGTPDNGRRDNQGVEGIAQSPDGRKLFALMQSALIQDSLSGSQGRYNTRLLVYDITGSDTPADPVAQYVIQLPRVDTTGSTTNGTAVDKTAAQSAIVALNDHQILILSRDGNGRGSTGTPVFKSVLIADTASATNIDGSYDAEGATVISGGALAGSITPMAWSEAVNLIGRMGSASAEVEKFGLNLNTAPGDINTICEKWEALALMPANDAANPNDYFLFVGNDNDFISRSGKYVDAAGVLQSYDSTLENDTIVLAYRVRITGPDNQAPFAVKAIADQSASAPTPFSFTFAADTFVDPESGVLTYTASKADDTALPSWLRFNGSTRTFSGTPTQSDAGSLALKVTATDAGASPLSVSTMFSINVAAPAAITSQPASRSVVSGRAATLTVVASGTPVLTYQWYLGVSGNTSSPVVGATSASYTTPVLVSGASYWVRATNAIGAADSATAVLTVALGTPISSTGIDVLEPNTVTWNPAGVTLNGTQFVNLGLQGMGRVAASTKDPVTGESLGSVSDMQVSGWRRNADGSYSGTFQFLPDRGYNNGTTYSNYAARLNAFDFTFTPYTSTSPTSAQNQIALTFAGATRFTYDHDGNSATPGVFTTGLLADGTATLFGTTVPVATGAQVQSDGSVTGRLTLDSEGLVLDQRPGKVGSGWIGDEYGASIYHFNAARQIDGQLRVPAALVPHKPAGTVNFNGTPDNGRRDNQGVEGIAQSPDGRKLFALMQSALIQDSLSGSQGRYNTRLLVYDITGSDTPTDPVAQYVIQLPRVDTTGSTTNGTAVDKTAAQSAIVALNDHQILILSRDGNGRGSTGAPVFKSVLIADTASATNIDGSYDAEGATVISGGALAGSITPMAWSEAVNLIGRMGSSSAEVEKFGLNLNTAPGDINTICEKWEALALMPANDAANPNDYFLFVGNDNDFISRSGKYVDAAGVLQSYDSTLENDTIVLAYRVRITGPDNQAPFVSNAIAGKTVTGNTGGSFTFAADTFVDPEGGVLTYTASKADDTALPSWLSFNASTRTFSGTPPLESVGTLALKVTATDAGASPLSASAPLTLTIASAGQLSFADVSYSASAADAGTAPNTFSAVVSRSGGSSGAVTVQVAADAAGGTLPKDTAYTLATATVSFAAGEVSKTVTMTLGNLAYGLLPGTVRIKLQSPTAGAVLAGAGTTTLVNVPLTPSFRPGTFAFAQETTTTAARDLLGRPVEASLVITRSNGSRGAASVRVTAGGAGLQNGVDYAFNPVVLNFVDGQTSAKIKVPLRYISKLRLPGAITLSLDGATPLGAAVGLTASANLVVMAPASVADTVKPTLAISAPVGAVVAESFKVAGVVADNVGVDRVEVRLNDGPVQYAVLSGTMGLTRTFSLPVLQPENGANKLDVTVYDLANNATKVTRMLSYTNMREELAGTFNGLIKASDAVSNATSGFVTMKVNNSGVFSGKALLGGATVPFTGILFNDGSARFMNSVTKTYGTSLALANGKTALGSLAITTVDGELGTATGTLKQGSVVAASVSLERAHFDGKMSIVEAPYLANTGTYTVVLASKTQVPSMVSGNYPQGDGIGLVTVKPDGSVALQGTLADGTAVVAAGSLSAEYTAVIYVPLYTNGGAFAARLAFDLDQPDSDLEAADALWLRPAIAASKMYPAGWPAGVRVDVTGASYVKPVASSTVSVLRNLGAESASGNAALTFSDGALSGSLVKPVNISSANRVSILPAGNTAYTLTLVPTSGAFSGTFLHSRGAKANFSGVILQKGANAGGYGFFLAPTTTTATTIESGGLSLTPAR